MILDDPALEGVAAVLFDEFHERCLDADLGLALARDAQTALREDLRLLVMSATLDGARSPRLLGDAPVIESRAAPFRSRRAISAATRREPHRGGGRRAMLRALRGEPAGCSSFLPGAGRDPPGRERLRERIGDPRSIIAPLYGALDGRRRTAPSRPRRRTAQGRAGDLDRRDQPDHRGRAHRDRLRAWRACRATSPTRA